MEMAFLGILRAQETPAAARILERWWDGAPLAFRVVRDASGGTSGFYVCLELRDKSLPPMQDDPLVQAWRRHLRTDRYPPRKRRCICRWLSAANGELPSPVQAACWLDVKRSYLELRPHLRRCYLSVCDLATYGPTAKAWDSRLWKALR
jgi:hypothetical protein